MGQAVDVDAHDDSDEEENMEEILADPHKKFLWAAENNTLDVVREMLADDAELVHVRDTDLYTPLHRASYNNHLEMVKLLISHGADIAALTIDGWTPLHSACRWGNTSVASYLLEIGVDVNTQTNGGQTPLHLASSYRDARDTIELLLAHPATNRNLKNSVGETPYDVCRRSNKFHCLFET